MAKLIHTRTGNCWSTDIIYDCKPCTKAAGKLGAESVCDVCHEHDEARGLCSECPPCILCAGPIPS